MEKKKLKHYCVTFYCVNSTPYSSDLPYVPFCHQCVKCALSGKKLAMKIVEACKVYPEVRYLSIVEDSDNSGLFKENPIMIENPFFSNDNSVIIDMTKEIKVL